MKFTKTTFFGAFYDGLVELHGFAFDVGARELIAHKHRPEYQTVYDGYQVSERTTGFSVLIPYSRTRGIAANNAVQQMERVSDEQWAKAIATATIRRANLRPVPLLKG